MIRSSTREIMKGFYRNREAQPGASGQLRSGDLEIR